jgi:hypothetical protein
MSEMRDRRETARDMPRETRDTPRDMPREAPRDMPRETRNEEMQARRPESATEPVRTTASRDAERTEMMWPDMTELHRRFDEVQAEFIEDPKAAVKKAERLIEEAVEMITKSMRERMRSMHRDVDGKDGDTEMLRQTMRGYRQWIESMEGRRAA